MSSEFSIGHTFHLFKLIFYVVTSFVLQSEEKYQKIKKKKSKNPKKRTIAQKYRKNGVAKVEQYLEVHIESAIWVVFACADFCLIPNQIPGVHITWYI